MRRTGRIGALVLFALGSTALAAGPGLAQGTPRAGGTGGGDAAADEVVATLKVSAETVEVKKEGTDAFKVAKDGRKLREGDTVRTDATGRAEVEYTDDSFTRLDVNTTFTIVSLADDEGNRQVEGSLEVGRTWNRTSALTESESFEQSGAGATAAVVGTAFSIECVTATQCVFTAVVDNIELTGDDGLIKLLTPLDQCDSTSGALCADITKIDPSQLPAWILENLLLDVERGFPFPDFPVTFEIIILDDGTVVATQPRPATSTAPTTPTPPPPAQTVFYNAPGTAGPPSTLGPYSMTPFAADARPEFDPVSDVASPNGGVVGFSVPLDHYKVPSSWATWSHGYTGDVYFAPGASVTLTMPPNTVAFQFYAEPNTFAGFDVVATSNDGTTSGPIIIQGNAGAFYFGFWNPSTSSPITSIAVTCSTCGGFAIGEFAIATDAGPAAASTAGASAMESTPPPEPAYAESPPAADPPPDGPPAPAEPAPAEPAPAETVSEPTA